MDDFQHPLAATPPPRGPVASPAPAAAEEMATALKAHRDSMSEATTHFEQMHPSDYKAFRARSKSLAVGSWSSFKPERQVSSGVPFTARSWEPTLEKAIRAIVSIKASHVRSFDTETSGNIYIFHCLITSIVFTHIYFFIFIIIEFIIKQKKTEKVVTLLLVLLLMPLAVLSLPIVMLFHQHLLLPKLF
jgi:hypothetical protein